MTVFNDSIYTAANQNAWALMLSDNRFSRTRFVSSVSGSSANSGRTPTKAKATLAAALADAEAGERIILAPSHAETLAAAGAATLASAGVLVESLGRRGRRAAITLATDVAASVLASAADCELRNIDFIAGINTLTNPINAGAGGDRLLLRDCDFKLSGAFTKPAAWFAVDAGAEDFDMRGCRVENALTISGPQIPPAFLGSADYNYMPMDLDFTTSTGACATIGSHETHTVTGAAEFVVLPEILTALLSADAGTLSMGLEGAVTSILGVTAKAQLALARFWTATTTTPVAAPVKFNVSGGQDVGVDVADFDFTAGLIRMHTWFRLLKTQSLVLPGPLTTL
jgi:hypothetical protein